MDLSLVKFVGAGLTSMAAGIGVQVPTGAIAGGYNLLPHLLESDSGKVRTLLQATIRDMWTEWKKSGLPTAVAETHLDALPEIMDAYRPQDDLLVGAFAVMKSSIKAGRAGAVIPARRLASATISQARDAQRFTRGGLSETIAFFFLERLYVQLLNERDTIMELAPVLDVYFYRSMWKGPGAHSVEEDADSATDRADEQSGRGEAMPSRRSAPSQRPPAADHATSHRTVEPSRRADRHMQTALQDDADNTRPTRVVETAGDHRELQPSETSDQIDGRPSPSGHDPIELPQELLADLQRSIQAAHEATAVPSEAVASLRVELVSRFGSEAIDLEVLKMHAQQLSSLIRRLEPLASRIGDGAELTGQAVQALGRGDFDVADQTMQSAEESEQRHALENPGTSRVRLTAAADLRAARAELAEARGDFRRSARHFSAAARTLPEIDRMGRWALLMREAKVLLQLADVIRDGSILGEAVDVYREAVSIIAQRDAPVEWAAAHVQIAKLLIDLAAHEANASRLNGALSHLDLALDVFARARATEEWAEVQVQRGLAQMHLGEAEGSTDQLNTAVATLRSALGALSAERAPLAWCEAQARLGIALYAQGRMMSESGYMADAITQLRSVIDSEVQLAPGLDITLPDIALLLTEISAVLSDTRQDCEPYVGAAATLERFLKRVGQTLDTESVIELKDRLSICHWRVGEYRQDVDMLSKAAKIKLEVVALLEQIGEIQRADELKNQLEGLHDTIMKVVESSKAKQQRLAARMA